MTPTEQDKELEQALDKLSELNKLGGHGHGDLADTCYICGISPSKLLAYITADRKRVALEARIDTLEYAKISPKFKIEEKIEQLRLELKKNE